MFYVFYVNEGYLQALDVPAALGSVHKLQRAIEEITRVPVAEQALLVSGGEGLQSERQVSHYQGAGTESNPVFLFRKLYKDDNQKSSALQDNDELNVLCTNLFDELRILETATVSRQLITRYCEAGRIGLKIAEHGLQLCTRLVQDHQLLYQGWLALVSNLIESCSQIEKKSERFFARNERLKTMKTKAGTLTQDFDNVLSTLHQIQIPNALLANSCTMQSASSENCTLYEYIARADPRNSLEEMSEQVGMLLAKMNDTEFKQVTNNMKYVREHVNNPELKNIRGINMRLTQLDSMLHSKEQQEKTLKDLCTAVSQPIHDKDIKEVVIDQRERMIDAAKLMEQLQKLASAFLQSKVELLNNIRTRLRGWILQVYDRLHHTNNVIILFEEKFIALRSRLDIIRQVKESPIMYATGLTESLRRSVLQPEFESWYNAFLEKANTVISEEISVREVFKQKLGRHFLKQLFPGMFDSFPNFVLGNLPTFDKCLPPVSPEDLRTLRQVVPSLAHLLKITDPCIYQRLNVKDPRLSSAVLIKDPILKREGSFYTSDAATNVANLNKHFPSTHWLSGDENLEVSPSGASMLAKSPPSRFGSSVSLDMAEGSPSKPPNPLTSLFGTNEEAVETEMESEMDLYISHGPVKSAPISIPQSFSNVRPIAPPVTGEESSVKVSDKSSQFGTPEEHISYGHQKIDDVTTKQNAGELATFQRESHKLSEELCKLREDMKLSEHEGKAYLQMSLIHVSDSATLLVELIDQLCRQQLQRPQCSDASTGTALEKIQYAEKEAMTEELMFESFKEVEEAQTSGNESFEDLKRLSEMQKEEINALREKNAAIENKLSKLVHDNDELVKTLVVDHGLALEREASSHTKEIKRKEKEIESLKATLQKWRETVLLEQSVSELPSADDIRASFEQEYKTKVQLLMAGIEEKNTEAVARLKKEAEFDLFMKTRQMAERITELERMLKKKGMQVNSGRQVITACQDDFAPSSFPSFFMRDSPFSKSISIAAAALSAAHGKMSAAGTGQFEGTEGIGDDQKDQDESDEDIAPVTVKGQGTQTTISLREMRTMITVQDIHELCAVLIVFSEPHNAYILFSINPVFHFVKESSLRRLGVKLDRQLPPGSSSHRPNWLMAITTRLELCKIRKIDNRYNLKVGTKFYRVEVEPLPIDSSTVRRHFED